jgi:Zn-dependent protease
MLATFNLMPVPPLDGSHILFGLLPARLAGAGEFLARNSYLLLILFFLFGSQVIMPVVVFLFRILTGARLG